MQVMLLNLFSPISAWQVSVLGSQWVSHKMFYACYFRFRIIKAWKGRVVLKKICVSLVFKRVAWIYMLQYEIILHFQHIYVQDKLCTLSFSTIIDWFAVLLYWFVIWWGLGLFVKLSDVYCIRFIVFWICALDSNMSSCFVSVSYIISRFLIW
jgi:hypothetical protein